MTDEVPVSDVLLEATEYLCKLGSNLKLRSESLKEKKICKTKLKNTHAVKKAADKLLLICELSKKSLENVENGVKKILRVCAKEQGPIPVKPRSFKHDIVYHYIKDGSQMLRMSKKICLEHFKSVKVNARKMPLSMQEKYPVYFDCKLYRRRKRLSESKQQAIFKNQAIISENSEAGSDDKEIFQDCKYEKDIATVLPNEASKSEKLEDKYEKNIKETEIEEETLNLDQSNKLKSKSESISKDSSDEQSSKEKDILIENIHKKEDKDTKSSKNYGKSHHGSDKNQSGSKQKRKASIIDDSNDEQSLDENSDKMQKSQKKSDKSYKKDKDKNETKKKKHARILDDSSDASTPDEKKEASSTLVDKQDSPQAVSISSDDDDKNSTQKNTKKSPDKQARNELKNNVVSSDKQGTDDSLDPPTKNKSLESTEDSSDDILLCKKRKLDWEKSKDDNDSENMSQSPTPLLKLNEIDDSCDTSTKNKSLECTDDSSDDIPLHKKRKLDREISKDDDDSENMSQPPKPLLKLVDLNKLLKPEIAKEKPKMNSTPKLSTKNREAYLSSKESAHEEREKRYWERKRNEAIAFKPKKFLIVVCRLPEFTDKFLANNKIKIITQKGEIIAERGEKKTVQFENIEKAASPSTDVDNVSNNSNSGQNISEKFNTNSSPDLNEVKSALLDDSDSDTRAKTLTEAEKVKKSLLIDSDSDGSSKEKSQPSYSAETSKENEVSTNKDQNAVITNKDQNAVKTVNEAEKVKKSLLHNSDSDDISKNTSQSSPLAGTSKQSGGTSDQEQITKTLTEADKVKSTLLKDSDSDDGTKKMCQASQSVKAENEEERLQQAKVESVENLPETLKDDASPKKTFDKNITPVGSDKEENTPEKSPITPKSKKKRKNMMESMHAKKMLLTYSSSSDTEDENLKDAIKEIKTSLLEGSEEEVMQKVKENHQKRLLASSSSDDEDDDSVPKIQYENQTSKKTDKEENPEKKNGERIPTVTDSKSEGETSSSSKVRAKKHRLH